MKILFVSHDDGKYGAAKSLTKMIIIQKESFNIVPVVITRKYNELNEYCDNNSIENYVLPYVNCVTFNHKNKYKLFFNKMIQNIKRSIANFLALNILKKKIDISEIDAIHTNVSTIDFGAILSVKYSIPHFWHLREFGEEDMGACPVYKKYYDVMNKSAKIFAISNAVRMYWIKKGIKKEKIVTIYNGINSKQFIYNEMDKDNKIVNIIFSGSAAPHKGVDQIIDAIEILNRNGISKVRLDIYGDYSNEYGELVKRRVEEKQINNLIQFKGFCSDMKKIINRYDIGVVCSRAEAFGRVTIEYMLSGVCVIASNTGANSEIIDNNENGMLYEYNDPKDLANKIEFIINNRELGIEYTKSAYRKAKEKFTANQNAFLIYQQIENILN